MKLSIVIPCLNHYDVTFECIDAVLKNTKNEFELIVIDDGSNDRTREIEGIFPEIDILIRNNTNRGFAVAINEGIRQSRGEYICIFNNDMIVKKNWDQVLIDYLEKSKKDKLGMTTGTLIEPPVSLDKFKLLKPTKKGMIIWEKGGPWMFKKEVFKFTGVFDEQFEFCQYEDLDFLTRMAYAGYKHARIEECLIYHYSMLTQKGELKKRIGTDYQIKNRAKFIKKWGTVEIDFEKAFAEEPQCA